jgi:hypothetical protein
MPDYYPDRDTNQRKEASSMSAQQPARRIHLAHECLYVAAGLIVAVAMLWHLVA